MNIKEHLKDLLIKFLLFFFRKNKAGKKIYLKPYSKILIIQLGNSQEALNITPLIYVLKNQFNASFSILVDGKNDQIFKNNKCIDTVFTAQYDAKSLLNDILKFRRSDYDLVINTAEKNNAMSSLFTGMIKAEYKVGFLKDSYGILTNGIELSNPKTVHIVDRILSLTGAFETNYSKSNLNILFEPSPETKKTIENYFIKHDLSHKLTTVINISSELDIGFWGVDNYKSLLKYLRNYNVNIVLSTSIDDLRKAEQISGKNYLIFYNTEIEEYAQLLGSSGFIFSPDSYTVQLAAAFKIPVFCLFVQHKNGEMINVPYNSDFDFTLTEKDSLADISYGKVLNSFVPYFEYVYQRYKPS